MKLLKPGEYLLKKEKKLDSVFGVTGRFNRFWFDKKPVNHQVKKLVRTQDLSPVYEESDVYFMRRSSFLKYGTRICGNFKYIKMSDIESIDIDTKVDFIYAESIIEAGLIKP